LDSIVKIKQVINSLEAQIQDEDTKTLGLLLTGLGEEIQGHGEAYTIVKMMQSIGRYLISRTSTAHPNTVPLLSSLAENLEILVSRQSLPKREAQEILTGSIQSFKSLKASIAVFSPLSKVEIEELKAVILSVDWEISNFTLQSFDRVISRLKEKMKSNKLHYTFLRIMHSIGGYIARNKAHADNNSINLLQSVFLDYEKLILNPEMLAEEKKQMIEGNIRAYNELKRGISDWTQTDPHPVSDDEDLPPALSHLYSAPAPGGSATLRTLTEMPERLENITPASAAAGKKKENLPPVDVMGDLFSPKTTPADELLDAIHLAELHGPGQQNPADNTPIGQEDGPGIKTFVPKRGGETPIPEIESRLDEFFNLDISENSITELPEVDTDGDEAVEAFFPDQIEPETEFIPEPESELLAQPEPESIPDTEKESISEYGSAIEPDLTMEMVPDDGIELIESAEHEEQTLLVEELKEDSAKALLERVKTILNAPSELSKNTIFTQTLEDLSQLDLLWETDTDKVTLIELLIGLTRYIHDLENAGQGNDLNEVSEETSALQVEDNPLEGEVQETLIWEGALPSETEDRSTEDNLPEDEFLPEEDSLVGDEIHQEYESEENVLEEEILEVEKAPKGFWGTIKSKFRK